MLDYVLTKGTLLQHKTKSERLMHYSIYEIKI
jgi:hypothetical protein